MGERPAQRAAGASNAGAASKSSAIVYTDLGVIFSDLTLRMFTHFTKKVCDSTILRFHVNILALHEIYDSSDSTILL